MDVADAREERVVPGSDPWVGRLIADRYHIAKRLGAGGMGVVYAARHQITGRDVAIKLMHPSALHSDETLARFAREARTGSAIGHPNIVEVLDAGTLPCGTPFLVMELLRGESLTQLLWREARLTPAHTAKIIGEAARALAAIHARGVIHRDVKTDNLFIAEDGRVKLLDFGLAIFTDGRLANKVTQDGVFNGTPQYMPPEVFDGGEPNIAWDVYALATVAFELLTGVVPFDDANPIVMLYSKRETTAPRLSLRAGIPFPAALERVLRRGLERDPARRHPSPIAFAEHLAHAARLSARQHEAPRGPLIVTAAPSTPAPPLESHVTFDTTETPTTFVTRPRGWRALRSSFAVSAPLLVGLGCAVMLAAWTSAEAPSLVVERGPASESPPKTSAEAPSLAATPISRREIPAAPVAVPEVTFVSVPDEGRARASRVRAREEPARVTTVVFTAGRHESPSGDADVVLAAAQATAEMTARLDEAASAPELVQRGTAALMRGMIPDALELLQRATLAAPESASAWRSLGLANERMGRRSEARRAYERYLGLAPNARDATEIRRRLDAL